MDNYICYNKINEYGHQIKICDLDGSEIYKIFLSDKLESNSPRYITTFWNNKTKKGIFEKVYSNRTEHYYDDKYYGNNFNDAIMTLIKEYTKIIMNDKKYPSLYQFIIDIQTNEKEKKLLIPKSEFD